MCAQTVNSALIANKSYETAYSIDLIAINIFFLNYSYVYAMRYMPLQMYVYERDTNTHIHVTGLDVISLLSLHSYNILYHFNPKPPK